MMKLIVYLKGEPTLTAEVSGVLVREDRTLDIFDELGSRYSLMPEEYTWFSILEL